VGRRDERFKEKAQKKAGEGGGNTTKGVLRRLTQ
jgi:hypothetical protein